jgi:hypothetical protein
VAGGQFVDASAGDGWIEREVEVLQRAAFTEARRLLPPGDLPLLADMEFVLENEFQELRMRQPVGFRFLQS